MRIMESKELTTAPAEPGTSQQEIYYETDSQRV